MMSHGAVKSRYFYFDHGSYGMGEETLRDPGPREVLVKTTRSLVSVGTESHCNTGRIEFKKGRHGYSNAGVVQQVGAEVTEFRRGDRVFSFRPHVDYYVGDLDDSWFSLYRIPEDLGDGEATFCTLAVVALHAVERAGIAVGQPVVVVGQGTVGQLVAQLARIAGAGMVIGVDPDDRKLELATKMGADGAIHPDSGALAQALARHAKQSPPPVFIEACGEAKTIPWMLDAAPLGSRIVLNGSFMGEVTIEPEPIVNKELEIIGSHQPKDSEQPHRYYPHSRPFNVTYVLDLLRRGRLRVGELVSATIEPEELLSFYDAVRDGKPRPAQPLIDWGS